MKEGEDIHYKTSFLKSINPILGKYRINKLKEMCSDHKPDFSNLYIFATRYRKLLIFEIITIGTNIIHIVGFIKGLCVIRLQRFSD